MKSFVSYYFVYLYLILITKSNVDIYICYRCSLLMTAIGGTLRNWRHILQVTSALHIVTPILCKYFPESPRWLLARKNDRHESEIKSILIEITKTNETYSNETEQKIDLILILSSNEEKNEPQHKKDHFIHIFSGKFSCQYLYFAMFYVYHIDHI